MRETSSAKRAKQAEQTEQTEQSEGSEKSEPVRAPEPTLADAAAHARELGLACARVVRGSQEQRG